MSETSKNKLEEQARSKGDISYSYWTNTSVPANSDVQPLKLSEGAVSTSEASEQAGASGQHTASTWNQAGTFEERDVTEWAKQRLQDMVVGTSTGQAVVTKCRSITGNANIWFIRGNKRSGFDFELDLEWQQGSSTADAQGTRGTLKVPSVGPDDLDDLHVEVSIDAPTGDGQADEAAWQAAKQLKQPLQDLLEQFLTELRSR